ncbi:hypothetical protein PRZ48_009580 [Zasmidium cellare]|uniref:Uncharacterized protein n=1 Tax=Zasmidium cellare TaxID=395010 RepID=A0ABR0ECY4_ZASCE|nr:hypothetical protein PRZ48_009580 [Zasmidium cellare]
MKPFPFFRLPRELRDQIYSELDTESAEFDVGFPRRTEDGAWIRVHGKISPEFIIRAKISSMPVTNFALVSRAFKEEYETELRRQTPMCLKIGLARDNKLRLEYLTENSKAHCCLRRIPQVEMRIWFPASGGYDPCKSFVGRDNGAATGPLTQADIYDGIRHLLLPYMANLKTFTQDVSFELLTDNHDIADRPSDLHPTLFADKTILLPDRADPVLLKTRVYLASALVSINPHYHATGDDISEFPSLEDGFWEVTGSILQCSSMNLIRYRALPAKEGEGMFWGLDVVAEDAEELWNWREAMRPLQRPS